MDAEELKRHIHRELSGDRFPTAPSVAKWKAQRKQAIMRNSVKIMRRHEQSEKDILRMLEDKLCSGGLMAVKKLWNKVFHKKK